MEAAQFFDDNGYVVLRDFWADGELDSLYAQLNELGRLVVGPAFSSVDQSHCPINAKQQSLLYDRLKYLPALSCMSGSPAIRELCQQLGLRHPSLMGCCNMRLDKPQDSKHLFNWHQDSVYLLGSVNAVTVWVPLHDVNLHRGTIQVIAGSHRRGLAPFKRISEKVIAPYVPLLQRDLCLDEQVNGEPVTIEASKGDIVVFKQMLVHRSTPNYSDQIRWTTQLRITDLADPEHLRQGFPTGDRTNIFYVDYPGHNSAARLAQEQQRASIA